MTIDNYFLSDFVFVIVNNKFMFKLTLIVVNMRKLFFGIIAMLCLIIPVAGCLYATKNHYEDDKISFDYPQNWQAGKPNDLPGAIIRISKENEQVMIFKEIIPPGYNFQEFYRET
jgi:hypothetical protein